MSSEGIHVADPIPQDAPATSSSSFFVVNLPDLARLSYCCDIGWVGINNDAVANVFQSGVAHDDVNTPDLAVNPTYLIASVPSKKGVFAYGVVMGSLKSLKSKTPMVKDRYKRDMPKYWDRVVRVAWLRVACAPWEGFAETLVSGETNTTLFNWLSDAGAEFLNATNSISSVPGTENPSATAWFKVPNRCGEELVAAIEAKGLTVLPHDLRAAHLNPEAYISSRQDGQVNGSAPTSYSQPQPPRSEQPIPMNFGGNGPQRNSGYNQHGNNGAYNQHQQGGNAAYYNQNQGGGYGHQQQHQQQQYGGGGGNAYGNYNYNNNGGQHQQQQQGGYEQQPQQTQEVSSPNQQQQASSSYLTPEQIEESAVAAFYAQSTEEQRNSMTDEEKGSTMDYYRSYYASYVPQ